MVDTNKRVRGGKLRYVDTTPPEDFIPDLSALDPSQLSLTELADAHGTDKGSLKHNYCEHYSHLIDSLVGDSGRLTKQLTILEIGVACGASLRTWSAYLPKSKIVGIDIREECQSLCKDVANIEILIGNATSKESLDAILPDISFDLIIDDGSHISEDINRSFELLWGKINPGGVYAVEDLACTYNQEYGEHISALFGNRVTNSRNSTLMLLDFLTKSCDEGTHSIKEISYHPQLLLIRKS